jgi:hypothetical protein
MGETPNRTRRTRVLTGGFYAVLHKIRCKWLISRVWVRNSVLPDWHQGGVRNVTRSLGRFGPLKAASLNAEFGDLKAECDGSSRSKAHD